MEQLTITRDTSVENINFGKHISEWMKNNGIRTVGDLLLADLKQLKRDPDSGEYIPLGRIILFRDMFNTGMNLARFSENFEQIPYNDLIEAKYMFESWINTLRRKPLLYVIKLGGKIFIKCKTEEKTNVDYISLDCIETIVESMFGTANLTIRGGVMPIRTVIIYERLIEELTEINRRSDYDMEKNQIQTGRHR